MERNLHGDARSVIRFALNFQMAAHRLRTLPHVEQPEMSGGGWLAGRKALTVVADRQADCRRLITQLDENLSCLTVLHRIGDCFLPDAEQVDLHRPREAYWTALNLEVDFRM